VPLVADSGQLVRFFLGCISGSYRISRQAKVDIINF